MRFSNKTIWEKKRIKDFCEVNPKTEELEDEFIYIDLESVSKGCLLSENIISKTNAPSRAQRVLKNNDILFQCVRPYQMNNLLFNAENADFQYVASTGYAQIRTQENSSFVYQLLHSPKFNKEVMLRCTGSSYPAISSSDLEDIEVYICGVEEQQKIGYFLDLIDRRIAVQNKIISKYETLIKGLKNQLYSRKARFTSHNKIPFPKWEKKQLSEILSISTEKNGSQYSKEKVLSVSDEYGVVNQIKFQGKSFAGQDISNYKVVKSGQIIYTRSPLAAKPFGIIKIVGNEIGIVSPLYIVNTVNNGYDALFVFYLFDTPQSTNNYLKPLVRVGAKHTMNISNDEWLSGTVIIPCLEEQKMIAGVLQSIDKKISFEKKVLEILKEQKTYLLSKMFI